MDTYRTILHPTDFSELSNNVLQAALALAQKQGARLILLHVQEPQEVVEGEFGMIPPPEPEPSDESILAELAELVPEDSGVAVECVAAHGTAAEEIVRVAVNTKCDVIIMASHGHGHEGFLSRLFHAHVAAQVERDAPCQVIAMTGAGDLAIK